MVLPLDHPDVQSPFLPTQLGPITPIQHPFITHPPPISPLHDSPICPPRAVPPVGAPLPIPRIPEFTQGDLEKWHAAYLAALKELYEAHKDKYFQNRKEELVIK